MAQITSPLDPAKLVAAALVPRDQLWFHSPEVQAGVAEAEADFREGRFTVTDTADDAQAYLDRLKGHKSGEA